MAETLISPGVFAIENDQSQITQGPVTAGAAIVGPTVLGPVNTPTLVTSYSQYKALFGAAFNSGGFTYEYLTSMAALGYFQQGGTSLLVTRVASGSYTPATASIASNNSLVTGGTATTAFNFTVLATPGSGSFNINGTNFVVSGSSTSLPANTATTVYVATGSSTAGTMGNFTASINASASVYGYKVVASAIATTTMTISSSIKGTMGNYAYITSGSTTTFLTGGTDIASFVLDTLSVGTIMDDSGGSLSAPLGATINGALPSGSTANVRYEVVASDSGSGLFSLIVRRGDDYVNSPTILETWNNLSLDPNQNNYIAYVIGNQTTTTVLDPSTGNYYLQTVGDYPNNSKYIRVKSVNLPTPNYLNSYGEPRSEYTGSLPLVGSGSYNGAFGGSTGAIWGSFGVEALNMFTDIPVIASVDGVADTNIQGIHAADYNTAINILGNKDAYQFNVIYAPGLTTQNAISQINGLLTLAQNRGDNIAVVDMVGYGQNIGQVTAAATSFDSSYGATYWPWVQVRSTETGKLHFVPASTMVPAVYEYNDRISAEWFAPAGFTRGGMSTVLQPERKLSVDDRNTLYSKKINPIATFPGVGTVIYGQKTLQQKASALDRVNVRRLLISLKGYISQVADNLVFEPNTQVTRNKFLNAVNPYLSTVQQRQGLYSFSVVMDDTNNTPDVVDRNELIGSIYLQPTRTAEFIYLTFNILPTGGVTFG
jgi:hypothetical protein